MAENSRSLTFVFLRQREIEIPPISAAGFGCFLAPPESPLQQLPEIKRGHVAFPVEGRCRRHADCLMSYFLRLLQARIQPRPLPTKTEGHRIAISVGASATCD